MFTASWMNRITLHDGAPRQDVQGLREVQDSEIKGKPQRHIIIHDTYVKRHQCDLTRPQCHKCTAAQIQCRGYRDEVDMLFRDETSRVVTKYSDRRPAGRRLSDPNVESSQVVDVTGCECGKPGCDAMVMDGELTDAVSFLFTYYLRSSNFEWVEEMYRECRLSSMFAKVVHAAALGAHSHELGFSSQLAQSRCLYNRALRQLRSLAATQEWTSVSTLASILLMSMFEILLSDGSATSITANWSSHVCGAFAIVETRGQQGADESTIALMLVGQTIQNYNVYCSQNSLPRPPSLVRIGQDFVRRISGVSAFKLAERRVVLHAVTDAFAEFSQACAQQGEGGDRWELIRHGRKTDAVAVDFVSRVLKTASFEVISLNDKNAQLPGLDFVPYSDFYHLYGSHHEARLWNGVRMIRMTICERTCEYGNAILRDGHCDEAEQEELQRAISESQNLSYVLQAEICASMPQFLRKGSSDCTIAAACFLAWPLFVAGRVTDSQCKDFVQRRLQWIGTELHIRGASIAAANLDSPVYRDDWLRALYMF